MRIGVTLHFYNFLLMIAFSKFSFSSQGRLFTNLGNTGDPKNCQNLREILFLFEENGKIMDQDVTEFEYGDT